MRKAVFPVKSSTPVRMTKNSPNGSPKIPVTILPRPGFVWKSSGQAPPTDRQRRPPRAM